MEQTIRLLSSMLFARSQNLECMGKWKCHWCGAPCSNDFTHDDPPPVPFVRSTSTAKCPFESYICVGCWAWRRPRTTIRYLSSGHKELLDYKDKQTAKDHSWFITESSAIALRKEDATEFYKRMLNPPPRFSLMLRTPDFKGETLIQLGIANDFVGIIAETPLQFTVNNIAHQITVYELEEAIRNGPNTYGPGIRQIFNFFGEPNQEIKNNFKRVDEDEKKERGRPEAKDTARNSNKKVILHSGSLKK